MSGRVLAIDTATPACSVALFQNGELIASDYEEIGRGHAERIVPMIAALPDNGRADGILVNCGPGSFTGVRIGISVAKALGLAWNAKMTGYQCLHLVAAKTLHELHKQSDVFVAMHGGHGEYFVQNFDSAGTPKDELMSLKPSDAIQRIDADILSGSAAKELANKVAKYEVANIQLPNAKETTLLADTLKTLHLSPLYGREPDAVPLKQV